MFLVVMTASVFFFFNDTTTTEFYTLSLHDALPILSPANVTETHVEDYWSSLASRGGRHNVTVWLSYDGSFGFSRSEEHTSELQSRENLVCRLLLEKKNKNILKNNVF